MPILAQNTTLTRANNDVNGNPRIVFHWLALRQNAALKQWDNLQPQGQGLTYNLALSLCKSIGGKKYHNQSYGGGIVVTTYNIQSEFDHLDNVVNDFVVDNTTNKQLTDIILSNIDISEYIQYGYKSLKDIIKAEKRSNKRLSATVVEDWLRGMPSACSLPCGDFEQENIMSDCGLIGWTSIMFWRYSAKVIYQYIMSDK